MSLSNELKEYLRELPEKKACCQTAVAAGQAGEAFSPAGCMKDDGCYLRGIFLRHGYVLSSAKGRELTLLFADNDEGKELTEAVFTLLSARGLQPKKGRRKGRPLLYYKDGESIEDFLSLIGGSKYALALMEKKVINELRSDANRLRNAETANLDRAARAAAEQCRVIRFLIDSKEYAKLSTELKECADLRMANPDMSLDELRGLFEKPVSKSGLSHRFARLADIARENGLRE